MKDMMKKMNNIRSLRAGAREVTLADMELILEKVTTVVEEKRELEVGNIAEQARKQERLNEFLELMAADGISPSDLMGQAVATAPKKPRKKTAPKYEWIEDGERKTWTGQGRKPKYIQKSLEQGMEIEQFAIAAGE